MRNLVPALCVTLSVIPAAAHAENVDFDATLSNSCVLSLDSDGDLALDGTGTVLGSEEVGGRAAQLGIVAVGASPTIIVGAPTLTQTPIGWTATPRVELAYTSKDGASQAYTDQQTSYTITGLTDNFVLDGRVTSASGFAAGSYNLRTVVTCQQ